MKKAALQILFVSLLTFSAFARPTRQDAVLFDEFGRLNLEETLARLESLAHQLSKDPETKSIIRIYGGDESCFACHYQRGSLFVAILKNTIKVPSAKFSIEYCVEKKTDLRTELYLVSSAAKLPRCDGILESPTESSLFDRINFDSGGDELSPLENSYVDVIYTPPGEYSKSTLEAVKNILDKSPESKIYVVVYLGTNPEEKYNENEGSIEKTGVKLDKKSVAPKMLRNAKKELIKNGIRPSQVVTTTGGYVNGTRRLEFWLVPKGGAIPKPEPDYFPKRRRTSRR